MAKFTVVVDHETQRDEVVDRLKGFSNRVLEESPVEVTDVEEAWDDTGNLTFSFKAMGFKISGSVVTSADKVTVDGKMPFAALPFRGAIESQIKDKVIEAIG